MTPPATSRHVTATTTRPDFETAHPRSRHGRFTDKAQSSPDIFLGPFDATNLLTYAHVAPTSHIRPTNVPEVIAALDARDLEPDDVRYVRISDPMARLDETAAHGPTSGSPLLIDVTSGPGTIRAQSGRIIIRADSPQGVDVEVSGKAEVTVLVARGRAAGVTAMGNGAVHVVAEEGSHGTLRVTSASADATLDSMSARFGVANTYRWHR